MEQRRPRILFLGVTYAGNKTRFRNLEDHARDDPRIRPTFRAVNGWLEGGRIERLPFFPNEFKARVRAVHDARGLAMFPRPDAIWTSSVESSMPHLWSQVGPLRRPLALDLDSTNRQLESFAPAYFGRPPKRGVRALMSQLTERALWKTTSLFLPWSRWAADGLRQQGVPHEQIRVLPPGVDLDLWKPTTVTAAHEQRPLRLLFVGGDFVRKGGDILLDVLRLGFLGRCELDIVTRDNVPAMPGVRVHRAEANSPVLRELYARADVFVLPTRAECFGIATVEAMASGIPVIVGDVGGVRDIVDDGETGWLITPSGQAFAAALEMALERRDDLLTMGRRGRRIAEQRFNGRQNDRRLIDWLIEEAARFRLHAP